ncbi:MAG TPA: GGDEF domain-containing protein [Tissierellaceae bacterium]|nr:GGDEF domain-containing protein [Tissierellaceae bacterium]
MSRDVYLDAIQNVECSFAYHKAIFDDEGKMIDYMFLDVDDFKDINDQYGHRAGDKVLQYLAMRVKQELREEDLIVRTGGDEFLLYLHDIRDEDNARIFVDRIYKKITGSYRLKDDFNEDPQNLEVSLSIGVAFYPKDGDDIFQLMSKADQALYRVKRSGKSDYHM